VPREPYNYIPPSYSVTVPAITAKDKKAQIKGKQPASNTTSVPKPTVLAPTTNSNKPNGRTPQPPLPEPTLNQRLPPFSPLVETGMLLDTIKAGLKADEAAAAQQQAQGQLPGTPGAGGPGGAGGAGGAGGGKGKGVKKVIRVRA
jgi:signal recognition particle subunit SRP19